MPDAINKQMSGQILRHSPYSVRRADAYKKSDSRLKLKCVFFT